MLEKIKNALFRFMNGRYGTDALNNFLLFASLAARAIFRDELLVRAADRIR